MNPSNDDCYFYYYSTCTKGSECPFRHCELALGTETVCTLWRDGLCVRKNCKFRHMESRINRTAIPCYWENQPGGCRKPHCVFFHQRGHTVSSTLSENKKLILPVASQLPSQAPTITPELKPDVTKVFSSKDTPENTSLSPASVPVEPVVVSLNDGEESDTESMSSTPAKSNPNVIGSTQGEHAFRNTDNDDLGIKTLEQLRMEKIHRESEHFYKSVYDAPSLENVPMKLKAENPLYPRDLFGKAQKKPASEVLEAYPSEHSTSVGCDSSLDDKVLSSDLRAVLQRKQENHKHCELQLPLTGPKKRVISLKRAKRDIDCESASITVTLNKEVKAEGALDFQIKTLAEIRKEKNQTGKLLHELSSTSKGLKETGIADCETVEKEVLQNICQPSLRARIKRPTQELCCIKPGNENSNVKNNFDSHGDCIKRRKLCGNEPKIPQPNEIQDELSNSSSSSVRRILRLKKSLDSRKDENELPQKGHVKTSGKISSSNSNQNDKSVNLGSIRPFNQCHPLDVEDSSSVPETPLLEKSNSPQVCKKHQTDGKTDSPQETYQSINEGSSTTNSPTSTMFITKVSCSNGESGNHVAEHKSDLELSAKVETDRNKTHLCAINYNVPESSVPSLIKADHSSSVDEFDQLLLEDDTDITMEDVDDNTCEKTEDIFLELEEMLKS